MVDTMVQQKLSIYPKLKALYETQIKSLQYLLNWAEHFEDLLELSRKYGIRNQVTLHRNSVRFYSSVSWSSSELIIKTVEAKEVFSQRKK